MRLPHADFRTVIVGRSFGCRTHCGARLELVPVVHCGTLVLRTRRILVGEPSKSRASVWCDIWIYGGMSVLLMRLVQRIAHHFLFENPPVSSTVTTSFNSWRRTCFHFAHFAEAYSLLDSLSPSWQKLLHPRLGRMMISSPPT